MDLGCKTSFVNMKRERNVFPNNEMELQSFLIMKKGAKRLSKL